jgi:hypothetical protein
MWVDDRAAVCLYREQMGYFQEQARKAVSIRHRRAALRKAAECEWRALCLESALNLQPSGKSPVDVVGHVS